MTNYPWTRRNFGRVAVGTYLGAYLGSQSASAQEKLEKKDLTLGFIPMTDCAPLVIAHVKGFFKNNGLNVQLSKEAGWAAARDGVIQGRLDASHALAGMPLSVQLGIEGPPAPMITALCLNLNSNAITFSKRLGQEGITTGSALKQYLKTNKTLIGSMVFASSMYNYTLRYWLAYHGIHPDKDLRLITLPPADQFRNLQEGKLDFFSVTEPWNQRAVFEGIGFTAMVDRDIWTGHCEKVLAVMEPWAKANPNTHRALVKSIIQACQYCDDSKNRLEVAKLISAEPYLKANPAYVTPPLQGKYDYGGFDSKGEPVQNIKAVEDFFVFYRNAATPYLQGNNQATYPWKSQGMWILTQMVRWGQIPVFPKDAEKLLGQVYRNDIYRSAAAELGIKTPKEEYKIERGFIDKRTFDPSNPVAYLKSFPY